jgi:hypothetical protein
MTIGRLRFGTRQEGDRSLRILLALAIAWLGLWAHELYRAPAQFGMTLDGSLPLLLVAIVLLAWWLLVARKRAPALGLLVYGLINGLGGFLSVLPLPFLPFAPEQTVEHYLIHVVYAMCQTPLVAIAMMALFASAPPKTQPRHLPGASVGDAR